MNLISRIILLFAAVAMMVFLVGGVISYRVMQREVDREQQRFLTERLNRWEEILSHRKPLDTLKRNQLIVIPLDQLHEESIEFSDTVVMHSQLERMEPHLKIKAIRNIGGRSYEITVYGVVVESDDIVDAVTESLTKIYLILLAVILPIGAIVSYYILRPFKATLEVIKNFSLNESSTNFPKSRVSEFKKLNSFLEQMTEKIQRDYKLLKEFSENASHELQTPLGIIQSKLEVLMDSENLTEEQLTQLSQIENTLNRLSNLSNSLSLLTKIENQEFSNLKEIRIDSTFDNMLAEFSELRALKSISLKKDSNTKLAIHADQVLIELLFSNLINNAIRHNWEGGNISVTLYDRTLVISNSGKRIDFDPNELFRRFRKSNQSDQSIGLGLAIVQTICNLYSISLSYHQADEHHELILKF